MEARLEDRDDVYKRQALDRSLSEASSLMSERRMNGSRPSPGRCKLFLSRSFALHQQHRRVLDDLLELREILRADRAVDDAVIASERAAHHRGDGEGAVLHHRALLAGADRENAAVRRVDDGGKILD